MSEIQRIALVCDPPVSHDVDSNVHGVQAVVCQLIKQLERLGIQVSLLTGLELENVRSGRSAYDHISALLDHLKFDALHIVTQGQLGLMSLRYCLARGLRFTSAYHSLYPEWLKVRHRIPTWLGYSYISWFQRRAARVLVPSLSTANILRAHRVNNVEVCPNGLDTERFRPPKSKDTYFLGLKRPLFLYVGRVHSEKGVERLCASDLPGTLMVVGDGPLRERLTKQYPNVHFAGTKMGNELVDYYQAADAFVFPSETDTYGLVILEALASGLPVAALPVIGSKDLITSPLVGVLDHDLRAAAIKALELDGSACREFALQYSWERFTQRFLELQVQAGERNRRNTLSRWFECNDPRMAFLDRIVRRAERTLFAIEHQQ